MHQYSVDSMKRRMFEDELQNVINLSQKPEPEIGYMQHVRGYFEERIKEIDNYYGTGYNGQER